MCNLLKYRIAKLESYFCEKIRQFDTRSTFIFFLPRSPDPLRFHEFFLNKKFRNFFSKFFVFCDFEGFRNLLGHPVEIYLEIYPIQLGVLVADLGSHIRCHIAQISNHGRHLLHIFFHLFFTIVISNP